MCNSQNAAQLQLTFPRVFLFLKLRCAVVLVVAVALPHCCAVAYHFTAYSEASVAIWKLQNALKTDRLASPVSDGEDADCLAISSEHNGQALLPFWRAVTQDKSSYTL